jgi:hypothetical protein
MTVRRWADDGTLPYITLAASPTWRRFNAEDIEALREVMALEKGLHRVAG